MNQVKYEALCPNFAYEIPCANLILKGYCCYQHNRFARRAEICCAELNEKGKEITEMMLNLLLTDPKGDGEEKARNRALWKKFPNEPTKEAR